MVHVADKCVSSAVDFENLSRSLQSKLGLEHYLQPTLVGYSILGRLPKL
jgi:hypothetical protein